MRVVLLEPPAWEGRSPAVPLAKALGVPHVRFGDLLRAHLRRGTDLGIRSAAIFNAGRPFPDAMTTEVVRDHLDRAVPTDFLLDGHPRGAAQALALDALLEERGLPVDAVLRLHLPEEELERRIRRQTARRVCRGDTARPAEVTGDAPVRDSACQECGGELHRRDDDTDDRVRGRYARYEALETPVVRHYAGRDLLVTVDAVGPVDDIVTRAVAALRTAGLGTGSVR
ncbi:adenylate kinase family protein [Streptacidiphilus rugosus]|uniref:adenylate kinase family protein n=1 Tax=Streptacidiphilus rugosus TaxID=405783 RepID=UPI0005697425|nr:nucleoside monophosphate kinase [Streptacidiphilus rugosus]